jgi:ribosomal protein S7
MHGLPPRRVTSSLMQHGRNNGKKLMAVRIIKHSFDIIHLLTDQNPIQVLVDAIINRRAPPSLPCCPACS